MPDRSDQRPLARRSDWMLGVRRGAWAYLLGAVLLLVMIPAVDDLRALLRTLGVVSLALGVVITLATVFLRVGPEQRS
ncbi:hypothetical protein [Nocardioides terrisoli]|uniref:hypothetical protein n=1 Tax=Nocardioides terrisoli TaxID=3388267 RepID=UPI00287B7BEE|nr:hypothetical protein [Nocardioides marmorisolisilvae]